MEEKQQQPFFEKVTKLKIGFIPLPIYLILVVVYLLLTVNKIMPNDMMGAIGVMTLFSFILEEVGKHIPILNSLGGKVLVVTFLPSFLVYKSWLPESSVETVTAFMKNNNFLSFFIALLIVGSICSMNRKTLLKASSRIILILIICDIVGALVGTGVGMLLGLSAFEAFFFVVAPIMAGGVGEGALPLSIGYAGLIATQQADIFASILPCVMLGSLVAVIFAGLLKKLGEKRPELTGNGQLIDGDDEHLDNLKGGKVDVDIEKMLVTGVLAITLYLLGVWVNHVIHLPAPIVLLVAVMGAKMLGWIPKDIENGGHSLYSLTVKGITPPLLFGVGVAMTPWGSLVKVFTHVPMLITIFATVLSIVLTAYFVGKALGMYPVDTAIAVSCCSGQGGTGALAILAAGNRMELMPFAQVSVRLGGAMMVTAAIFLMSLFV